MNFFVFTFKENLNIYLSIKFNSAFRIKMIEFFLILQLISSILGQDFCSYPVMNYSEIDVFNLGDRIILKSHIIGSESKYWNYNCSSGLLDKSPLEVKDFIENSIISVNIVFTFVLKIIVHFQRTHKSF
jgi:hypothetical protein